MVRAKHLIAERLRDGKALARVKHDLDRLDSAELMQPNVDARAATAIILAAVPRLRELRPRLVEELAGFDLARFDRLEDYALAFRCSNTGAETTVRAQDNGSSLLREAACLRDALRREVKALAKRGVIDAREIAGGNGGRALLDLAQHLERVLKPLPSVAFRSASQPCVAAPQRTF